jgi:acyl-CoA synthetase (AMP-forming)/AMP-acid ligase II
METTPLQPWTTRIEQHGLRPAIVDPGGTWSYADLLTEIEALAAELLGERSDLDGDRVARI